jgi:hypothetical protein
MIILETLKKTDSYVIFRAVLARREILCLLFSALVPTAALPVVSTFTRRRLALLPRVRRGRLSFYARNISPA